MTIQELDNKVNSWINVLRGPEMGNVMATVGEEALTIIRDRIRLTGKDAEGQAYTPYSTKPMLAGCKGFLDQAKCPAKTKSGRKELKWATIERKGKQYRLYWIQGGYKEFRDMNLGAGHSSYVDFFFSGRMWQNIKLIKDSNQLNVGIATIKATDPTEQKKLNANVERRTHILRLSQKEVADLSETFISEVKRILK